MTVLKSLIRLPARKLQSLVMEFNYLLDNYKDVIWLIGDGRSGTTWVSDLINWEKRYREMFEPFHPTFVKGMERFCFHQYIRTNSQNNYHSNIIRSVFSGKFTDPKVDRMNYRLYYDGILIKDIFANLFSSWVKNNLPHVKLILLIRNPFMVALSKQRKKNWIWMTDPTEFLLQQDLYKDYLAPHEEFIRSVSNDYVERQILIWAILHYVPFKQLRKEQVYILFYEDLYINTDLELLNLFKFIHGNKFEHLPKKLLERVNIPSRVSEKESSINKGKLGVIDEWKDKLTPVQIRNGMNILEHFGLEKIYSGESMPNKTEIEKLILPP